METVYRDWKTIEREREQKSIVGEVQTDLKLWKFFSENYTFLHVSNHFN